MRFLSENRTSLVVQPDRNRITRDLSENRTRYSTRLVRKPDKFRKRTGYETCPETGRNSSRLVRKPDKFRVL